MQAILLNRMQRLYIICGLGNLYKFYCVFDSGDCIPRLRVQHTSVLGDDLPGDGGQQEEASQPRHLGSGGLLRQAGTHCFHINLDLMRRFSAMVFWILFCLQIEKFRSPLAHPTTESSIHGVGVSIAFEKIVLAMLEHKEVSSISRSYFCS